MLDTIIVGVDGREGGRQALALARSLAERTGGTLVAVHVHPHEPLPTFDIAVDLESQARAEAEELLRGELAQAGLDVEAVVTAASSPGRGIQRVAEERNADLIVVGPSHRGAVGRVVAGDTVRAVLQGAARPVAVARDVIDGTRSDGLRIGVGFDGSPESREALSWAKALAEAVEGTVRVLSVAEPPQAFSPSMSYGINWVALVPEREEWAQKLVTEATAELGDGAVGETAVGVGYQQLVAFAAEVDLLVLGSRGYGPVRRTLLGSTSDRVVHVAPSSVIVLPRGAA